jgi:hypothetical protein
MDRLSNYAASSPEVSIPRNLDEGSFCIGLTLTNYAGIARVLASWSFYKVQQCYWKGKTLAVAFSVYIICIWCKVNFFEFIMFNITASFISLRVPISCFALLLRKLKKMSCGLFAGDRSPTWHSGRWGSNIVCVTSDVYSSCTSGSAWLCWPSVGKSSYA